MELTTETKLDFDQTVGTEDRFSIRHALDDFAEAANTGDSENLNKMIADSTMIEGFSDLPYIKEEFISVVSRWVSQNQKRIMRFPLLKLSFSHYLYHLTGTYEQFADNILVTEGTIELAMIKQEDGFKFVKIIFFPRMRLAED